MLIGTDVRGRLIGEDFSLSGLCCSCICQSPKILWFSCVMGINDRCNDFCNRIEYNHKHKEEKRHAAIIAKKFKEIKRK